MDAALISRPRRLAVLLAAALALGLAGQLPVTASADADGQPPDPRVGHTVKQIIVPGSLPGETREVTVHLWYPADPQGLSDRPKTSYHSALSGKSLPPPWTPLAWEVEAEVAREDAPIDPHGPAFPVIVFSHGSNNDPIDYAYTLEELAGAGFVVAAPYHINNTQDDVLIDYINDQAGTTVFPCNDGLPSKLPMTTYSGSDCQRLHVPGVLNPVPNNMRDRVRDISDIIGALPGWFGDRVDTTRVGVMGHSRGTVTALATAGGSAGWGIDPLCRVVAADGNCKEPAVKAVMGLAIGAANITNTVDLAKVTVPTVLVAGGLDKNSAQAVSEHAFATISRRDKLFVSIPNAVHRSFDSTYCAELQSAATHVKSDPNAILDLHTIGLIAASAPGGVSGKAVHYCAPQYFTSPVNTVVGSIPNSEYSCPDPADPPKCVLIPPITVPTTCPTNTIGTNNLPCTGLDTEEVTQGTVKIAVAFFDTALKRTGNDRIDFKRYLAPTWLIEHVPMVGSACTGPDSITPPHQSIICSF